jgi:predicted transcriptional regulator of viral defense system
MATNKRILLFEVADRQQGYFTSRQAEECGYHRANFGRRIKSGEWERAERGIYRLTCYSVTDRPELALCTLWSCSRAGIPQAVCSHDTALEIYDLSDVSPHKIHMTVPPGFRRRTGSLGMICLHHVRLKESEVAEHYGFRVKKPLRTLIDVVSERALLDFLLIQACEQALERRLVTKQELAVIRDINSNLYELVVKKCESLNRRSISARVWKPIFGI